MAWDGFNMDCYYRIMPYYRVCDYLLKNHKSDKYPVPEKREQNITGVTITGRPVLMQFDDAKEYVKAIINGEFDFIPHYYVCMKSTWRLLEDNESWIMPSGKRGEKTVCVAVLVGGVVGVPQMYNITALNDAARLTAFILHSHNLPVTAIAFAKDCPEYILLHKSEFKRLVKVQYKKLK